MPRFPLPSNKQPRLKFTTLTPPMGVQLGKKLSLTHKGKKPVHLTFPTGNMVL